MAKTTELDSQPHHVPAFLNIRALLVLISVSGIAIYWFRQQIVDFILSTWSGVWHAVLGNIGLGIAPIALWFAVVLFALAMRRSLFNIRYVNLWLSSIAFLALVLGIMAFFQPIRGGLAPFTLYGEVALSGRLGEMIIGSTGIQGIVRTVGLFAVAIAIALPYLAAEIVVGGARLAVRLLVWLYIVSVVGVKRLATMYKVDKTPSDEPPQSQELVVTERRDEIVPTGEVTISYAESRTSDYGGYSSEVPGRNLAPQASPIVKVPTYEEAQLTGAPEIIETEYYSGEEAETGEWVESFDEEADEDVYVLNSTEREELVEVSVPAAQDLQDNSSDDIEYDDEDDEPVFDDEDPEFPDNGTAYEPEIIGRTNSLWNSSDSVSEEVIEATEEKKPLTISLLGNRDKLWARPPLTLMKELDEGGVTKDEMLDTAETIRRTLSEYGVEVEVGQIRPGPTVTMYGLIPGWVRRYKQVKATDENGRPVLDEKGKPLMTRQETKTRVKVDNILSREKDLALALKTPSIRIETPVMGKSQVGIEVPNPKPSPVSLRGVMESEEFKNLRPKAHLPIALGKGSGGETVVIDLAKMPHLLIAGATGSGKSVCLNTIVSCLILEKTPADLRLLLIDPKRVELTPYNGVPHLMSPVVVDTDKVVGLLKGVIHEMMNRYRMMEEMGVRNIEAYNKRAEPDNKMPFMVVVVDELADLMMTAAFDVEQSLCRLAQLGRATGIHLIIATQRPSVDVVTGLIKANFPSRISFGVTSQVDSRTILDATGAEKLLGRGDMLYLPIDGTRAERVQGVFISDPETESLVNFWQSTEWLPIPRVNLTPINEDDDEDERDDVMNTTDELFQKAIELARTHNKLSTSLLQRRMRIGYPRAARLMDELEDKGIVGPSDGSKSRDVIITGK